MENHTHKPTNLQDLLCDLRNYMHERGISYEGEILTDGKFHSFSIDSKSNKKDERYVAYKWDYKGNTYLSCYFGSHSAKLDQEFFWYRSWERFKSFKDDKEREEFHQNRKKREEEIQNELRFQHNFAAEKAIHVYGQSDFEGISKYLQHKQVNHCFGLRYGKKILYKNEKFIEVDSLIIPAWNVDGELRSVQYIYEDEGKFHKRFSNGSEKKGCFFNLFNWNHSDKILICEGVATALTLNELTNLNVVCAFDADNLTLVAKLLKNKYPEKEFILCADDDRHLENNKGKNSATKAALELKIQVIIPKFLNPDLKATDFNDMATIEGKEKTKQYLEKRIYQNQISINNDHPPFKIDCFPDLIKNYLTEMQSFNNTPMLFLAATFIQSCSGLIGKRIRLQPNIYFSELKCNLNQLCIGPSGIGKTDALKMGKKLSQKKHDLLEQDIKPLRAEQKKLKTTAKDEHEKLEIKIRDIKIQQPIFPSKSSTESLLQLLTIGCQGNLYHSEFGSFLEHLKKDYATDLKSTLTDLYDGNTTLASSTKSSGNYFIQDPFIGICGFSTIEWVQKNIDESDITSGFLTRYLIYNYDGSPKKLDDFPSSNFIYPSEYEHTIESILMYAGHKTYAFSNEFRSQYSMYKSIMENIISKSSQKIKNLLNLFFPRWLNSLVKISLIFQLFDKENSQLISKQSIDSAWQFIQQAIHSTITLLNKQLFKNDFMILNNEILNIVQQMHENLDDITIENLINKVNLPYFTLKQHLNHLLLSGYIDYDQKFECKHKTLIHYLRR